MKLKELKDILRSPSMAIQPTIVRDRNAQAAFEVGCSTEYAIKEYGECEVERIAAFNNHLVLTLKICKE